MAHDPFGPPPDPTLALILATARGVEALLERARHRSYEEWVELSELRSEILFARRVIEDTNGMGLADMRVAEKEARG